MVLRFWYCGLCWMAYHTGTATVCQFVAIAVAPTGLSELNPAEQVWRNCAIGISLIDALRDQIVDACCDAWNAFTAIPSAIPFTLLSFLGQSY